MTMIVTRLSQYPLYGPALAGLLLVGLILIAHQLYKTIKSEGEAKTREAPQR